MAIDSSGGLAEMLGCDRNLGPLKFIITGPFVNKFEAITMLLSKISMLRRLQVKEMKVESSERKHFSIAWDTSSGSANSSQSPSNPDQRKR